MRANEKELSYFAESGLHQLWIKIQVAKYRSFVICTTYHPSDTSLCCFDTALSGTLTSALSLNEPIYILGGLNCNALNTNDPGQNAFLNFCNCFNLTQLVEEPTRITEHSRTFIDVILTTTQNNVKQTVTIPCSIESFSKDYEYDNEYELRNFCGKLLLRVRAIS